jgi:ankyrin repeat protein
VKGTCQWILSDPLYRDWNEEKNTSLLWISGYPGSGKTILSAYLLDYLSDGESSPLARKSGKMPCYFFCDEKIETQRDATAILRSLIHQLLLRHRLMIKHIKKAYELQGSGFEGTFEALWRIFVNMASDKKLGPVIVIVDAIDECEESTRERFLQKISSLVSKVQSETGRIRPRIKFVITSRPLFGRQYTSNLLQIDPSQLSVEEDLRLVIREKVEGIAQRTRCKPDAREYLENVLYSKADRTFLWVSLVLHLLEKNFLATQKDFQRIVDELPQTLTETYERFLQSIPENHLALASRLLHTIIGSARPLTLDEMGVLIAIEDNHRTVAAIEEDAQPNVREMIEGVLGPLVRFWDSKIYLVHQSLKEYLQSLSNQPESPLSVTFGVNTKRASLLMAKTCASYLLLDDFKEDLYSDQPSSKAESPNSSESENLGEPESDEVMWNPFELEEVELLKDPAEFEVERSATIRSQFKLFDYAAIHWANHFLECGSISTLDLNEQVWQLSDTTIYPGLNWFCYYWPHSGVDLPRPEDFGALVTACFYGHTETVYTVQNLHKSTSAERGMYWAARMGHADIVEFFLEKNISPDVEIMSGETTINTATQFNHKEVVKLLLKDDGLILDKNVHRVNYAALRGRTPLSIAAGNGFKDVVRLLLAHDFVQPDQPDHDQWTPLFWSVGGDHLDVVQLLITDPRVDVNHVDRAGRNVLSWAASSGALGIVKYLISLNYIDAGSRDAAGRTALSWAAGNGHLETTKFLRRSGRIDVTDRDDSGRNALSWACGNKHYKVVEYLLKYHDSAGADRGDEVGWTPLAWALLNSAPKTVEVLLSSGKVDINKKDEDGVSPLHFAVGYGWVEVVKIMVDAPGVELEIQNNSGVTPLSKARHMGNADMIKVLEDAINK